MAAKALGLPAELTATTTAMWPTACPNRDDELGRRRPRVRRSRVVRGAITAYYKD